MNADFVAAVAAIDCVHGVDDSLPEIPLINAGIAFDLERRRTDAWFDFRVSSDNTIEPGAIGVKIGVAYRQLKTLHEVGHFLDAVGLPGKGFASAGAPELADWRTASVGSRAYRELLRLSRLPEQKGEPDIRRALRLDETWARSYSQFIAGRSSTQGLDKEVEALRLGRAGRMYYPLQWTTDDFAQIDAVIATLFVRLGWMT